MSTTTTPTSSDPKSDQRQLDHSLATGLAWTAAAKWSAQVLSWASTLIVARLLAPDDYGIIGMAAVYLGVVQIISEFGLSTVIVQRELPAEQISRINGISLLIGLAMFAVSAAAAPLIAMFFREPPVRAVVIVLATTYVITSLQVVPIGVLSRERQFRRIALIESAEVLAQVAVTLGLAIAGASYWALIFGNIAGKLVNTTLMVSARGHRFAWPRQFSQLRSELTFGWHVVVARLSWYGYSNADFVVIGRLLGKAALGAYTFGWTIASLPADKISGILARVTMPIFAAVQEDAAALQRYVVRISEAIVVVVLPASIGMALVARDFVQCFLGDRWSAAIIPLQLLSIHVTIRVVNALLGQLLFAVGDARQNMRVGLWLVGIMPVLFVIGAKLWGPPGVALMWLVGHPIITFPSLIAYTARRIEMPLSRFAEAFGPPVIGVAVMAVFVLAAQALLPRGAPSAARLALGVGAGAVTYPAFMWLVYRERMRSLISTIEYLRR